MQIHVDPSSRIVRSTIGKNTEIRECSTIHDSTIGPDCHIYEHVSIKKTTIGRGVAVNSGTYIENATIEDDVLIGPNCSIVGVTHQISKQGIDKENKFERVIIRRAAFFGAACVVLPGVTIGRGSVIAVGAIVSKSVPARKILIGIRPNQTIKEIGSSP